MRWGSKFHSEAEGLPFSGRLQSCFGKFPIVRGISPYSIYALVDTSRKCYQNADGHSGAYTAHKYRYKVPYLRVSTSNYLNAAKIALVYGDAHRMPYLGAVGVFNNGTFSFA